MQNKMIRFIKGNIFDTTLPNIVNTVNTKGVMGKGLALQFKERYPKMFKDYQKFCKCNKFNGGDIYVWSSNDIFNQINIINIATKEDWRCNSKIEWIEKGLINLLNLPFNQIAVPKLGCNNGGLNWEQHVKPLMVKYLSISPKYFEIYI